MQASRLFSWLIVTILAAAVLATESSIVGVKVGPWPELIAKPAQPACIVGAHVESATEFGIWPCVASKAPDFPARFSIDLNAVIALLSQRCADALPCRWKTIARQMRLTINAKQLRP
jgi:hypothetical protein